MQDEARVLSVAAWARMIDPLLPRKANDTGVCRWKPPVCGGGLWQGHVGSQEGFEGEQGYCG